MPKCHDGTLTGLDSSGEEENETGEQTSPYQVIPGMQLTTPRVAISTQLSLCGTNRNTNARRGNTQGGPHRCGQGRGQKPGSHYFGAGGQSYRTVAPDQRTHLQMRSIRYSPHPLTTQ